MFGDIKTSQGLNELNKFLADNSYIVGYTPSKADESIFDSLEKCPEGNYPYIKRWYKHIASYSKDEKSCWGGAPISQNKSNDTLANNVKSENKSEPAADDDDIDLFGSDEEEDAEAERIREERVAAYSAKKSKKPALIAKSSVLLDCKPWDDETDMAEMEKTIRTIEMDGLLWGASKLVPVGYGIKKLQIMCVIEDDKVSIDLLQEKMQEFEDFVQSVDIAAFNKI